MLLLARYLAVDGQTEARRLLLSKLAVRGGAWRGKGVGGKLMAAARSQCVTVYHSGARSRGSGQASPATRTSPHPKGMLEIIAGNEHIS